VAKRRGKPRPFRQTGHEGAAVVEGNLANALNGATRGLNNFQRGLQGASGALDAPISTRRGAGGNMIAQTAGMMMAVKAQKIFGGPKGGPVAASAQAAAARAGAGATAAKVAGLGASAAAGAVTMGIGTAGSVVARTLLASVETRIAGRARSMDDTMNRNVWNLASQLPVVGKAAADVVAPYERTFGQGLAAMGEAAAAGMDFSETEMQAMADWSLAREKRRTKFEKRWEGLVTEKFNKQQNMGERTGVSASDAALWASPMWSMTFASGLGSGAMEWAHSVFGGR